jgi:hypothetical protein
MADRLINLNNYKASGVYTVEVDASENVALPLATGRLVVGSSKVGPFNTVVLINDVRTLRAVFGDNDPKLEKAGSYFHRTIEVALREGPVFALNVLPFDTDVDYLDPTTNEDQANFTTFNTEAATNNPDTTETFPIVEFFNKRTFWAASADQLNRSKNLALGDDFITAPESLGEVNGPSNKILSFVNTGKNNVTIWVKRSDIKGYDVTAKEWYNTIGGGNPIDFPNFVHEDDLISDYFVEVIVVSGDWSNNLRLATDPIYANYFDASGLKAAKMNDFFSLREVKVISRAIGCLIPEFKDQGGSTVSIDRVVNRLFPTTGIMCALDASKLEKVDLTEDTFADDNILTHRIDLAGYGVSEMELGTAGSPSTFSADDGGSTGPDGSPVEKAPVALIDVISYTKPADTNLVFKVEEETLANILASGASGETFITNNLTANTNYIIAIEGSKLYEMYTKGFVKTGDIISGDGDDNYIKTQGGFLTDTGLSYAKITVYSNIGLTTQVDPTFTTDVGKFIEIAMQSGKTFAYEFDLTDTNFFEEYVVLQPNKLELTIDTANAAQKEIIDEFIKVNHYIKAQTLDGRTRFLKIISIVSSTPSTGFVKYVITTMTPMNENVVGLNVAGNLLYVQKGIQNFADTYKGQYLKGFVIRDANLPNGSSSRQKTILQFLWDDTSIPQALASGEAVDFRYVVDSYAGDVSSSSKYYLAKIAALHGQAMAILNAPSIEQFEKSTDPSFIDSTNKMVSTRLIAQGGDLDLNPSFTFAFAEEDVNGVPLSSYSTYFFPNLLITEGNKTISVPPAAYVSNTYVRKFKNGTPFLITAGAKRGNVTDPEIVGLEYNLTDEDRAYLEPVGYNLLVRRRGFGTLIFSNNTAYQRINSALNNAHVRDNLSTIERDIERIMFNFLFDFNDEITRLRVKTIVENYLDAVVRAEGLTSYKVIFDKSNNTNEVISANTAIMDIRVDFPRGIHKFINRITITKVGGQLSSDSTGFIPSF